MNGGADLGGMMGFGRVVEEDNEPTFHARWEERVLGMTVALGACGQWNIDQGRYARESMQPADYMKSSYYQVWLYGITSLLKERNMINEEELASGIASLPAIPIKKTLQAKEVMAALMAGGPADRKEQDAAIFTIGRFARSLATLFKGNSMTNVDLTSLPNMVLVDDEPVFNEPWEAQAFAMVIDLHQKGAFTWSEWATALSSQIHGPETRDYYQHWLHALETLVAEKQLTSADALSSRKAQWHEAAANTPHGEPIELKHN